MCSRNGSENNKLTNLLHHCNVPRTSRAVDMCTSQKTERRLENWSYKLEAEAISPRYIFQKILRNHTEISRQGKAGPKVWRSYIWICQCRRNYTKRVTNVSYVKMRYTQPKW